MAIPGVAMFFDIASAFASILRRIVFDTEEGDEAWLRKLKGPLKLVCITDSAFKKQDYKDWHVEVP